MQENGNGVYKGLVDIGRSLIKKCCKQERSNERQLLLESSSEKVTRQGFILCRNFAQ